MNKLNSLFLLLFGFSFIITSCKDDEFFDRPTITEPTANAVQVSLTATFTFGINAPGKVASINATATGGTVTVKNATALTGQTTGNAEVEYKAPATAGLQTITITVTDQQSPTKTDQVKFIVNVTAAPVKPVVEIFSTTDGVVPGTGAGQAVTWTKDKIYILRGFVFVNDGETLTIEAGTVIKGQPGEGAGASALIVAKGGKLIAKGTANEPIIMTALADDTDNANDLTKNVRKQWGSLILLGKAKINDPTGSSALEGIPTTEPRGIYGGTDDNDNSGELSYISLRHGGSIIGANNEINGLTLGGVGKGTKISYIEVYANADDGYEWFGGSVDAKYLISAYNDDDAIDTDQGFTGKIQYLLAVQEPGVGGRGCECNGVVNDAPFAYDQAPEGLITISNATFIGHNRASSDQETFEFRQYMGGKVYNSIFYNFPRGIRVNAVATAEPLESETRLDDGELLFANNLFSKIGSGTTLNDVAAATGGSGANTAGLITKIQTMLANNNNTYNNTPGLQGLSLPSGTPFTPGGFNPLLTTGGAADGVTPFNLNATDNFFDTVTKIGAFPTGTNWANTGNWTALKHYGFFN